MDRGRRIRVLRRVCKYLLQHKLLALLALSLMLTSNLLALVGPKLSGEAIGAIGTVPGQVDIPMVLRYAVALLVIYALSALLSYLTAIVMVTISQRIVYTMRREVFEHLTALPVNYFDTHATGNIVSHLSYDIDTINASLSNDLLQICASVVTVVGSLIMMITIQPVLLVVFLFTVPASLLFTKYRTKKVQPLFKRRSACLGELNGYAEEMLSGQRTIRAYAQQSHVVEKFDRYNEDAVDAYYKADYHAAILGPTVNFINNLSISLVTMLGGICYMLTLTMGASLSPLFYIELGDVSAFVQYSRKFAGPINEFANILSELQSATAAAERVFALLDEPPEKEDYSDAVTLENCHGEVELSHMSFGYVPEKEILHDLTLSVPRGSVVAIVGPTGAGKTTIINLLMRFYDADRGEIRVDGYPLEQIKRRSLRLSYTMVLQDTWLFEGTIRDNIAYGLEGATEEDVKAAARAAHIDRYIESLPQGYDTVLSDDGVNISKGQKQLITIARAMLPKSAMLILDEATSNVDSRTEHKIQRAMLSLMEGRTCFVIAHRLSTIQHADLILVLKDGCIIEKGNHEQLLAAGGFYSSLYHAQFR
ncbi:MAG: ABC transporter ATP-binding protein [Clostridia bacterium]|nr:ABC transporter ATP-binding protein [Clostridia bacterium]